MTSLQRVPFEVEGVKTAIIPASGFAREQIELLKRTFCKDASDDEFDLFVGTCERLGLNPWGTGQIFFVKRYDTALKRNVGAIQIGINGLRLAAEATREYQGRVGPAWCALPRSEDAPLVWRDAWLYDDPPAAARVGVVRAGYRQTLWNTATWREFAQYTTVFDNGKPVGKRLTRMWEEKPSLMLAKCAEAGALRAAFQEHFGDIEIAPRELGITDRSLLYDVREEEPPIVRRLSAPASDYDRFVDSLDEAPEPHEPAAPVKHRAATRMPESVAVAAAQGSPLGAQVAGAQGDGIEPLATEAQVRACYALAAKLGCDGERLNAICRGVWNAPPNGMKRDAARYLYEMLKAGNLPVDPMHEERGREMAADEEPAPIGYAGEGQPIYEQPALDGMPAAQREAQEAARGQH